MSTVQLEIKVDAETKKRVEAAAAEKNVSVDEYLLSAVQRQLVDDGLTAVRSPLTQDESMQLVKDMRALRATILAERNGELIDVDAILDLVRDEGDAELYDLR